MNGPQRLVVCLDGTWNNRDDSTNVLHHFGLVQEGDVTDAKGNTFHQRKYYHPGVGTGVLDRISGGGFGFGLEENVRDAYNWLVENFHDATENKVADEIYIFGFSRGAYTARSLVGFIGRCGLLRRGAPITVNQLWENYCILGREHEERSGWMEKAFGDVPTDVRQITELIDDPWQIKGGARSARPEHWVPGQRLECRNVSEELLVRWSRRVRITYLGVYDTVGAIGFDALAIPILKSKLALHHNMRPTTLIQSCRHALALHEQRSSFSHTPFVSYIGHESNQAEQERAGGTPLVPGDESPQGRRQNWDATRNMWRRKIEQRWFPGSHSNVGGGYFNNTMAQRPFAWLLEGACERGLVCENLAPAPALASAPATPRDSYAEFAVPFWTMVFRSKRYYRPIDPEPEVRAGRCGRFVTRFIGRAGLASSFRSRESLRRHLSCGCTAGNRLRK